MRNLIPSIARWLPVAVATVSLHAQTRITTPTLRFTGDNVIHSYANPAAAPQKDSDYTVSGPNLAATAPTVFRGQLNSPSILTPHNAATAPIPPWLGDTAESKWIGPSNGGTGAAAGEYIYTTTFNLAGLNPATAILSGRFAVDNELRGIRINGNLVPTPIGNFNVWTSLEVSAANHPFFRSGQNTLEFIAVNGGPGANPAGFRAEMTASAQEWTGTAGIVGKWNFDTSVGDPPLTSLPGSFNFSTSTPTGQGRSLTTGLGLPIYLLFDNNRQFAFHGSSTLALWVRPTSAPNNTAGEYLIDYGGEGGYRLWLSNGRRLSYTIPGKGNVISSVVVPSDGNWHHVAIVHRAGRLLEFHLDGHLRESVSFTHGAGTPTHTVLQLGSAVTGTAFFFNGLIDDVVIAGSALQPRDFLFSSPPGAELFTQAVPGRDTAIQGLPTQRRVVGVGDVDGDGIDDALLRSNSEGFMTLVFGERGTRPITLDGVPSANSRTLRIQATPGEFFYTGPSAGDVNGDGYSDIVVSSASNLYVLFGRPRSAWRTTAPNGTYSLASLSPSAAGRPGDVVLTTPPASGSFEDIAVAGDVDLDGADEILVGTSTAFHLLYGGANWQAGQSQFPDHPRRVELMRTADGGQFAGLSVSGAGDFNGDGRPDLAMADLAFNRVVILFGQPRGTGGTLFPGAPFSTQALRQNDTNNRRVAAIYTDITRSQLGLGFFTRGVGDANGDGLDDVLVGYHRDGIVNPARINAGRAYLLYGTRAAPPTSDIPIDNRSVSALLDSNVGGWLGYGLGPAGDENGDGIADMVLFSSNFAALRRGWSGPNPTGPLTLPADAHQVVLNVGAETAGAVGDLDGDGFGDWSFLTSTGQPVIRYGTATANATATARSSAIPAQNPNLPDGILVPARPVGRPPGGPQHAGFTRASVGFRGGSDNNAASQQAVSLFRRAPAQPSSLPPTTQVASVHWQITTVNRGQFSRSLVNLSYLPSEIAGLDITRIGVWYTPDMPPTANSTWLALGAQHDTERRMFRVERSHNLTTAQAQFNGTYAIFSTDLVYNLGSEIPRPGSIEATELPPTGPVVTPLDATYWDDASKKLFAARPGAVTIQWRTPTGDLRGTTVATLQWPTSITAYQDHLLDTPPVSLTAWDSVRVLATEAGVDPAASATTRIFTANASGRTLLQLSKSGVTSGLLLVRSRRWNELPGTFDHTAEIGREIALQPDLIDNAAPSPVVLTRRARHAVGPGFYGSTPDAPIIPVNVANPDDDETRLVVAAYRRTQKVQTTVVDAQVPDTFWPGAAAEFTATWPTNPATIVIASELGAGPLPSATFGSDWQIYFQNDESKPGFNPNDEHTRKANNRLGELTAMPLRSDLGSKSQPHVLVAYTPPTTPRAAMRVFRVTATDIAYPGFQKTVTAGHPVLPPAPLSSEALSPLNTDGDTLAGVADPLLFLHKDRKGGLWAKAAGHDGVSNGVVFVRFYYLPQESDYFPPNYPKPASGSVPLLDIAAGTPGIPIATQVTTVWPANAPVLAIPESLVDAKRGLPVISLPPNPDGTPGVGGPCSVTLVYDQATAQDTNRSTVSLIDPLQEQVRSMGRLPTAIQTEVFQGVLRFKQLPPHLYPRFTYRATGETTGNLVLAGAFYNEPGNPEGSFFLPNVLSASEVDLVKALAPSDANWTASVQALADAARTNLVFDSSDTSRTLLAVSAGRATGSGWVTLAMQDRSSPLCNPDAPVSLEVFRVGGPYRGEVATLLAPDAFDERITFKHKADFAGDPDGWHFEWRLQAVGLSEAPAPIKPADSVQGWNLVDSGTGKVTYTIGGASPFTLGDNRVIVRFRPLSADTRALLATPGNPDGWSDWTAPKLGLGWVKRVLAGINPYEQRFKDLSDPTRTVNTTVNMLAQAGRRWEGNIPLDGASTDSFGLIEIYETVYRRARQLSIDAGVAYQPANDALLLAASRLADLYTLLGNEAFADASDPTLAILDSSESRYVNFAPTIHAFQGLAATPDLLAEELALLRGRDNGTEPAITRAPVYNRLPWNLSGDLGRVAYMANYDIRDALGRIDGNINADDAQYYFPQGHGDAWGHYLTAQKFLYKLAINPLFTWIPRSELDEIGGVDTSVDYQEEQKFIRLAAAKARTGAEIVNLTYRDRYTENPDGQWQGYRDTDRERAWGVADWGHRAGQAAYLDWVLGNALLPEAAPRAPIAGIRPIDRGTQPDFSEIAGAFERIQSEVDNADQGLNPLGLERNVMPFDISVAAADGEATHYEQIYERAIQALSTAVTTFYYAAGNTQRLRQQSDELATFQSEVRAQEFDFQSRLIEVFGQPYREDVGVGGAYPAGYTGPDFLHYDYIDPSPLLGLVREPGNLALRQRSFTITYTNSPFDFSAGGALDVRIGAGGIIQTRTNVVPYTVTDAFGMTKPAAFSERPSTGEIQQARSELLQAIGTYRVRLDEYEGLIADIQDRAALIEAQFNVQAASIGVISASNNELRDLSAGIATAQVSAIVMRTFGQELNDAIAASAEGIPDMVGTSNDVLAPLKALAKLTGDKAAIAFTLLANAADASVIGMETAKENVERRTDLRLAQLEGSFALQESINELQSMVRNESTIRYDLYTQLEAMTQLAAAYRTTVAKGLRLMTEFQRFRFETAASVAQARHKDMAYRVFRNDALQKYRAQFDLAARYAYLAARAYDFETAFLPGDRRRAGAEFLNRIVRSRVIGNMQDNDGDGFWNVYVGGLGDSGLADALARMNENWTLNLRSQLGFNNPQPDFASFSLRYDHFQITPHDPADADGNATWRAVLSQPGIRRANLLTLDAFNRYCIPFSPRDEINGEPALVIPFSSTVNAGQNFFGNPLVEGQDQFDSTKFATKIRSVKIIFEGLAGAGLASQPFVYLVPTGADVLRSPSDPRNLATRQWTILDQAVPVPFALNYKAGGIIPSELSNPSWIPSINGVSGSAATIRRYGQLRAFDDQVAADGIASTRLVGRSVWNTRWLLIIPGRGLLSNPAEGIERFLNGPINAQTNERTGTGVTDIRIEFETYAVPGL
jgi:hypothetical protein